MIDKGAKESGTVSVFHKALHSLAGIMGMLAVVGTLFVIWSYATYGDIRSGWSAAIPDCRRVPVGFR